MSYWGKTCNKCFPSGYKESIRVRTEGPEKRPARISNDSNMLFAQVFWNRTHLEPFIAGAMLCH